MSNTTSRERWESILALMLEIDEAKKVIDAYSHRTQLESQLTELNDVLKVASDNGHPNLKQTFQYMLDRIKALKAALEKQA